MLKKLKFLSFCMIFFVFFCFSISVISFSATNVYTGITFLDKNDFAIVLVPNQKEAVEVVGTYSNFVGKFSTTDKSYLTWEISNPEVATFIKNGNSTNVLNGTSNVNIKGLQEGNTFITITYDNGIVTPFSITSYVAVQNSSTDNLSEMVSINGIVSSEYYAQMDNLNVPLFPLSSIYGNWIDNGNVISTRPSALNGVLYALECKYDSDGTTDINSSNWDWDWVKDNIIVDPVGGKIRVVNYNDRGLRHFTSLSPSYSEKYMTRGYYSDFKIYGNTDIGDRVELTDEEKKYVKFKLYSTNRLQILNDSMDYSFLEKSGSDAANIRGINNGLDTIMATYEPPNSEVLRCNIPIQVGEARKFPMLMFFGQETAVELNGNDSQTLRVSGFYGMQFRVDFNSSEKPFITWEIGDPSVAVFERNSGDVGSFSGNDFAELKGKKVGTTSLTATYLFPYEDPISITIPVTVNRVYMGFDDEQDKSIKLENNHTHDVKVMKVLEDLTKTNFISNEKQYLTWTISDPSILKFKVGELKLDTISGVDVATILSTDEGEAELTITYSPPGENPKNIVANIKIKDENLEIVFENSDDRNIKLGENNSYENKCYENKVMKFLYFSTKTDFVGDEIDYITWTTSDESVVALIDGLYEVDEVTETDEATIVAKGQGSATITITYDTPDDNPVSVTSNVTVEGNTVISSVTPITISVDGVNTDDFTMTNATVPLFRLKDIYGTTYNDSDVLKKQPTALHGLLYALECHYDSDGTTDITNGSWDWDWVSANVDVTSQGTYVSGIGSDDNNYTVGWQYKVNTVSQSEAASINPLSSNDGLTWEYTIFGY